MFDISFLFLYGIKYVRRSPQMMTISIDKATLFGQEHVGLSIIISSFVIDYCRYGDRGPTCQDVYSYPYQCYAANRREECCDTCEQVKTSRTGIHYANMPMQYAAIFEGCKNDYL